MAQYTFSFLRSEYERIPIQLKAGLNKAVSESSADEETKKLIAEVCALVEAAVSDIAKYSKDQLKLW